MTSKATSLLSEPASFGAEDHEWHICPHFRSLQPRTETTHSQHAESGPIQKTPTQ